MTITGVPVSINSEMTLVDAIITVDFAELSAQFAGRAACNRSRSSRQLRGAVGVKVTNQRPWK
jgi:hypothetical protein